ncbi:MAG: ABC-F family ATP-binding cassette domain-containing protein [Bdellovibrionaceae bacterium]|nr:ABC-F family ATP-binding cassette domain-containing protein [Pseudobdellovibrionaceae bacterium]
MNSIITFSDVSFEFPNGHRLFTHISFSIEPKLTALVGPNGIGKTCLANLITGALTPTQGSIQKKETLTFFPQRQIPEPIPVDQFLSLDYTWSALSEKLLDGIDGQTLCSQLSGGQWMRVRLSKILDEQFLVLDEPTNDLDREGRQILLQFLKQRHTGALLISHDRECLELCEEVFELSSHGLTKFGGSWRLYEDAKKNERAALGVNLKLAKRERDQAFINQVNEKNRQDKKNRRGTQQAMKGGLPRILIGGRKRRAQNTTGKIAITTLKQTIIAVQSAHQAFEELKTDPIMYANLIVKEIPNQKLVAEAIAFNVRLQEWLFKNDLNFSWRGNVRIALKGANGSGKTTLLNAVLGHQHEIRGELRRGNLATCYIDQQCSLLDDSKSIFDNIRDISIAHESEIRNNLAKFLFTKETVFQKVSSLSGGERLRASLAKGLLQAEQPEFLILDEPTNNLDLGNIEFLENLVREFKGALIITSHDEVFLKNCNMTEELEI